MMFQHITLFAAVILATSCHENDWKTDTGSKTFSLSDGNMKDIEDKLSGNGQGNIMELVEKEISKFRREMQSLGNLLQEAQHEIKQLKETIQIQADEMKIMNEILKRQQDNAIPSRDRRAGLQGWLNETGIAFSAYLSHQSSNMAIGHTIKCNKVLLNDGNAYSPLTGTFTAPTTGVYFLTYHISAWGTNDETIVKLVVNNRNIVDADAEPKGTPAHHANSGNSAIIQLNSGEKVWLEVYSNNNAMLSSAETYRFTTFSGYMLY